MKLGEKEYFRIFAHRQIMEEENIFKMNLVLNHTMDYRNILSQKSRIHTRISNLVFGKNPEKNLIFFRPLEIVQGSHMKLVFYIEPGHVPILTEIGAYGRGDDAAREILVLNHTKTTIEFDAAEDHEYEVTVVREGECLDDLWPLEYLECHGQEIPEKQIREIYEKRQQSAQGYKDQIPQLHEQIRQQEEKGSNLKKELEVLQQEEKQEQKILQENETEIVEKQDLFERLLADFGRKQNRLASVEEDLQESPKARKEKQDSYRRHIGFLQNVEKYYRNQKKDEKFSEILQSIIEETQDLEEYFRKLETLS